MPNSFCVDKILLLRSNLKQLIMKKIFVAIVALIGLGSLQAQNVKYGLKGGLNIANLNVSGEASPSMNSIVNLHIGAFAEFKINNKVAFQPELLYSMLGYKYIQIINVEGTNYDTNNTLKFAYLNIPLMFKYYPQSQFYFEAGPQLGLLTSAKVDVDVVGFGSGSDDVKEFFKTVDFGMNVGLGYNFSKNVLVGARYNFGLSNIADTEPGDNTKMKNSVFSLSLGYIF